jgi:hypothetical protein
MQQACALELTNKRVAKRDHRNCSAATRNNTVLCRDRLTILSISQLEYKLYLQYGVKPEIERYRMFVVVRLLGVEDHTIPGDKKKGYYIPLYLCFNKKN